MGLAHKTLVVSSWAPPMAGASPHFFYTLFSNFDPTSYGIFTDRRASNKGLAHPRLPGPYYYFDTQATSSFFIVRVFKKVRSFIRAVRDGLRIIRTERYTLLLGTADKGDGLLLMFVLSILSRTPYVLYFLDLYRWNHFGGIRVTVAHFFEPVLFRCARAIFVMGDGHKRFYERKYGNRFKYTVIRNCSLDVGPHTSLPRTEKPYVILYGGGIYWAQERAVRNLIRAVTDIDLPVELWLYTPRELKRFEAEHKDNPRIVFRSASQEAMADIQDDANILFLPLSFNTPSPEVIEMATPGKTVEYLVAERPILVHAPPYAFLTQYAKEKGFAHVVDTEDSNELQDGIRKILLDSSYAKELVSHARTLYRDEYNLNANAEAFALRLAKISFGR